MKRRYVFSSVAALSLGACSTVEQVPLVYVSTAKVGVNVESGSAEVPGASIMVGVDLTDAAYVPVAVARRCGGESVEMMQVCAEEALGIVNIYGSSKDITEEQRAQLEQLQTSIKSFRQQLSSASEEFENAAAAESAAADLRSKVAAVELMIADAEKVQSEWGDNMPEDASPLPESTTLADARAYVARNSDAQGQYETAVAARKQAAKALKDAQQSLSVELTRMGEVIPDSSGRTEDQLDALSVFGSFDGNIGGDAGDTSATVALGKSFSTGVAAQKLADGIANTAAVEARTQCVASANAFYLALSEQEREKIVYADILAACSK